MRNLHWQDWLMVLVGFGLISSPFTLSYSLPDGLSLWYVVAWFALAGLAAIALGVIGAKTQQGWDDWIDLALGIWLIAAPWLVGFAGVSVLMSLSVICGVLVVTLSVYSLLQIFRDRGA